MASKVNLLKLFSTGQGIAGGLSNYVNYPVDHDSNYTGLETTVNQLVDELAATRAVDALIPTDILESEVAVANGSGRFSPWECKVTFTTTTVTVTTGRILAAGRRILVVGDTFPWTATGTWYVATDANGLLAISTTIGNSLFDIAKMAANGTVWTGLTTDYLSFNEGMPLNSGNVVNRIAERVDGSGVLTGQSHPGIRTIDATGDPGDAGFGYLDVDEFAWQSQRTSGHGSGSAVGAAHFKTQGQLWLMEQARVMLVRSTTQVITTATETAIAWDTIPGTNVAGDPERFEPEAYTSSANWQAGTALRIFNDVEYEGTWMFTAFLVIEASDETFLDVHMERTAGGTATIARQRVAPAGATESAITLSGMFDMETNNQVSLFITHDATGSLNMTEARITAMLVGGPVA